MLELHREGGMQFMAPLTLMLLINLALIGYGLILIIQKKKININMLETMKQVGGLALAWGTFSTVIGLYFAFGSLSEMKETLPLNVIMGGLQVAVITVNYGLIIFIFSLVAFIVLKTLNNKVA